MSILEQLLSSKELTEQDKETSCELAKKWRCEDCGTSCSSIKCAVLEMAISKHKEEQKIKAIKKEIENTPLTSLENMGEVLDSIIHIVYGVEKKEKLFQQKAIVA